MKASQYKYKNRYGDVFTFTKDKDNNILWEGDFKFCRFGMPNDYTDSYNEYVKDGGNYDLETFKSAIHELDSDGEYKFEYKYRSLVGSLKNKIDMIDPSGGPYISTGMKLDSFGFKGHEVVDFEVVNSGYKIITKK